MEERERKLQLMLLEQSKKELQLQAKERKARKKQFLEARKVLYNILSAAEEPKLDDDEVAEEEDTKNIPASGNYCSLDFFFSSF